MTCFTNCARRRAKSRSQRNPVLAPDLVIPRVPAAQLALIEKDLDAGRTQSLANLLGSLRIL